MKNGRECNYDATSNATMKNAVNIRFLSDSCISCISCIVIKRIIDMGIFQ